MKRSTSKVLLGVILSLSIVLWGNFSDAAIPWQFAIPSESSEPVETPAEKIVADKDSYDGKEVSVTGAVSTPRFRASRHGKPYMTFPLLGGSGSRINILFWGDIKLKTGKKIKIQGTYRKTMEMGKYTFRDVIETSNIEMEMKIQEKNP